MSISSWTNRGWLPRTALAAWAIAGLAAHAQPASTPPTANAIAAPGPIVPHPLQYALEAAWVRHPEARSAPLRHEALQAQRRVADAWTPEPAALEAATRTDRLTRHQGLREFEVGVAVPLWLPGERSRTAAAADGELAALDSRTAAAKWRLAASVRDAWWTLQMARQDHASADARLVAARLLAADVERRVKAGDLARVDQNHAETVVAGATAEAALARAREMAAALAWGALVGPYALDPAVDGPPEPEPPGSASVAPSHPVVREAVDKVEALRRSLALGQLQRRGHPELKLLTTRERGSSAEPYGQSVTVGVRIPIGSDDRHRARTANLSADLIEAEAALAATQLQLQADVDGARGRVAAARTALQASERRAALSSQTEGFIDKAYRAGEVDLPTRLRAGAESADAVRESQRARLELHRAISSWRQALGLLPD
jgi:outer membrane protein, heavy metal efflux system